MYNLTANAFLKNFQRQSGAYNLLIKKTFSLSQNVGGSLKFYKASHTNYQQKFSTSFLQVKLLNQTQLSSPIHTSSRGQQRSEESQAKEEYFSTTFIYLCSACITMVGAAYAAVPLYKIFCKKVGLGGDAKGAYKIDNLQVMNPVRARKIKVSFNANANSSMLWNFTPSQKELTVVPGETALAFYTAKNPTDEPIVGVATYNVVPYKAGLYFNKIQCFCFEEQWLNPNEEVDMPIFFYIDPDFDDDPDLAGVSEIALSYTFFRARQGMTLPLPGFMQADLSKNTAS